MKAPSFLPVTMNENTSTATMKVKRAAEHQINKDEYEANVDERDVEAPDPGQGMTRATDDVMARRKILKVSR